MKSPRLTFENRAKINDAKRYPMAAKSHVKTRRLALGGDGRALSVATYLSTGDFDVRTALRIGSRWVRASPCSADVGSPLQPPVQTLLSEILCARLELTRRDFESLGWPITGPQVLVRGTKVEVSSGADAPFVLYAESVVRETSEVRGLLTLRVVDDADQRTRGDNGNAPAASAAQLAQWTHSFEHKGPNWVPTSFTVPGRLPVGRLVNAMDLIKCL